MIEDVLRMLGAGGEVVFAASIGFLAWYLVKGLRIGRAAGSVVASAVRYGAAVFAFLAVGIALGWVDLFPGTIVGDLLDLAGVVWELLQEYGADLLENPPI
jgi:hypothetical protein